MAKISISKEGDKLCIDNVVSGVSTHGGLCLICNVPVYTLPTIVEGTEFYFHGYLCGEHKQKMANIFKKKEE